MQLFVNARQCVASASTQFSKSWADSQRASRHCKSVLEDILSAKHCHALVIPLKMSDLIFLYAVQVLQCIQSWSMACAHSECTCFACTQQLVLSGTNSFHTGDR